MNKSRSFIYKQDIDMWGTVILNNNSFTKQKKKILHRFNYFIRTDVALTIKNSRLWFQGKDKSYYKYNTKLKKYENIKKQAVYPKLAAEAIVPYLKNKKKLSRFFFFYILKYYKKYSSYFTPSSNLLATWVRIRLNKLRKTYLYKSYFLSDKYFYSLNKKTPFVVRNRFLSSQKKLTSFYMLYFCFSSVNQMKTMFRKYEFIRLNHKNNLGIYGIFISQLFRTNIFPTTRYCYVLVKMGAFYLNGKLCINPHKTLKVGDSFWANPIFIRKFSKLFKYRLRKHLILVNIPNYIDYCYKTFRFCIWRIPLKHELYFVLFYPFVNDHVYLLKTKKLNVITKKRLHIPWYY